MHTTPSDQCGAVSGSPPFSRRLYLYPEHEGSRFLGNVGKFPTHYAVTSQKTAIFMEVQRTTMLMREAASTSQMLVPTRRRISQDYHPITHHRENFRSHYIYRTKKLKPLSNTMSSRDKFEKNVMGGACSAYGGEQRRIQGFGGET
jgi:hypothetical protein